jgi:hypothetical protein
MANDDDLRSEGEENCWLTFLDHGVRHFKLVALNCIQPSTSSRQGCLHYLLNYSGTDTVETQ